MKNPIENHKTGSRIIVIYAFAGSGKSTLEEKYGRTAIIKDTDDYRDTAIVDGNVAELRLLLAIATVGMLVNETDAKIGFVLTNLFVDNAKYDFLFMKPLASEEQLKRDPGWIKRLEFQPYAVWVSQYQEISKACERKGLKVQETFILDSDEVHKLLDEATVTKRIEHARMHQEWKQVEPPSVSKISMPKFLGNRQVSASARVSGEDSDILLITDIDTDTVARVYQWVVRHKDDVSLTVLISSHGGNPRLAREICNLLKTMDGRFTLTVVGNCSSAAVFILDATSHVNWVGTVAIYLHQTSWDGEFTQESFVARGFSHAEELEANEDYIRIVKEKIGINYDGKADVDVRKTDSMVWSSLDYEDHLEKVKRINGGDSGKGGGDDDDELED